MHRLLAWLILALALSFPAFGVDVERLVFPNDPEVIAASGETRTALATPAPSGEAAAPEPPPVLDGAPAPRPGSVPVRLLIRRFNE